MRQQVLLAGVALVFGVLSCRHTTPGRERVFPVRLQVGETFDACAPARSSAPRGAPSRRPEGRHTGGCERGAGVQGVGPGTTLCSAASSVGPSRNFRITVR